MQSRTPTKKAESTEDWLGVKSGKVQTEQMFSGLSFKADARRL
jgi:hypothetical protein